MLRNWQKSVKEYYLIHLNNPSMWALLKFGLSQPQAMANIEYAASLPNGWKYPLAAATRIDHS
jgi:hypothetical protein